MGAVKRHSPGPMPSPEKVGAVVQKLKSSFRLCGSRGEKREREPNPDVHAEYRVAGGDFAAFRNRHVIIFVHGYNVTATEAVTLAEAFFVRMQEAFLADGGNPDEFALIGFTWPGDVGPAYFDDAQAFAHLSGIALYRLVDDLTMKHNVASVSVVSHSLGAHVLLRSAAILGERRYHKNPAGPHYAEALLLAPAVEHDVFERAFGREEYHFPDAAFGIERLHMVVSRGDGILRFMFKMEEGDQALGTAGPRSMKPLQSLQRRVKSVLGDEADFKFEVHDFSPRSPTIINPKLWVENHGDYWTRPEQAQYYVNFIR